jgi:ribosomal protein L29
MKKTDKISYRQKAPQELKKDLTDLRKSFVEAKAKFATGNQTDTSVFRKIKKQVSLVLTLLSESNNEKNN